MTTNKDNDLVVTMYLYNVDLEP